MKSLRIHVHAWIAHIKFYLAISIQVRKKTSYVQGLKCHWTSQWICESSMIDSRKRINKVKVLRENYFQPRIVNLVKPRIDF